MKDLVKDKMALQRLANRLAKPMKQVDNSAAYAGSPMLFYCRLCGYHSDTLPESYTSRPKRVCNECQELKDANPEITEASLIEMAKALLVGNEGPYLAYLGLRGS